MPAPAGSNPAAAEPPASRAPSHPHRCSSYPGSPLRPPSSAASKLVAPSPATPVNTRSPHTPHAASQNPPHPRRPPYQRNFAALRAAFREVALECPTPQLFEVWGSSRKIDRTSSRGSVSCFVQSALLRCVATTTTTPCEFL